MGMNQNTYDHSRTSKKIITRVIPALLSIIFLVGLYWMPVSSHSTASHLTITPITWNVVGLDAEDVNRGPNTFPVGVRVCNTGDTAATNLRVGFLWVEEEADRPINLVGPSEFEYPSLAANGGCTDVYFTVAITRETESYGASASYYIATTEKDDPA